MSVRCNLAKPRLTLISIGLVCTILLLVQVLPAGAGEIHDSIRAGEEDQVARLLRTNPDLAKQSDEDDQYQSLPLHYAAGQGEIAIAELLLSAGAEVDGGDSDNSRPIDLAAVNGQVEMVKFLLKHGADIDQQDKNGFSPLSFAMNAGRIDVVELLIKRGADIKNCHRDGLNGLLPNVADRGHILLAELLLKKGGDIHYANHGGATLLHRSAQAGQVEMTEFLLKHGVNANAPDDRGQTPLIRAVQRNQPAAIPTLLANGAKVNQCTWQERQTALHFAVLRGRAETIKLLLAGGADTELLDSKGQRPIDLASRHGHKEIVSLLGSGAKGSVPTDVKPALQANKITKDGEASIIYLNHSGYAVKTKNHLLIFDYWERPDSRPDEPSLLSGCINADEIALENVVVFVSHSHSDHYDPIIFNWREKVRNITYVLGCEPEDKNNYIFMEGRQERRVGDLNVRTIASNDSGVGFVVEVDGVTIFHAGDHANRLRDFSGTYKPEIEYLVANNVQPDIAVMPVSGCRFRDPVAVKLGVQYTLETLKPKVFLPAHAGGSSYVYAELAEEFDGRFPGTYVCAPDSDGDSFYYQPNCAQAKLSSSCPGTCSGCAH